MQGDGVDNIEVAVLLLLDVTRATTLTVVADYQDVPHRATVK